MCDSLLVCSLVLEVFELLLLKMLGSVEVEDASQGIIIVVEANQGIDYTLHCPPSLLGWGLCTTVPRINRRLLKCVSSILLFEVKALGNILS